MRYDLLDTSNPLMVFTVYDEDDNNLIGVLESMLLLEDNYLGGSGSRGFGQISFDNITISKRDSDYYKEVKEEEVLISNGNIAEAIEKIK